MRMNAAETSVSSAIADWTLLAAVSRSCTTAEMETFISEVSTTRTNIAIARRTARPWSPFDSSAATVASALTGRSSHSPENPTRAEPVEHPALAGSYAYSRVER
jgi:hypothetical protein